MPNNDDNVIVPRHIKLKREQAARDREVARTISQRKRAERDAEERRTGRKRPSKIAKQQTKIADPGQGGTVGDIQKPQAQEEVTNGGT